MSAFLQLTVIGLAMGMIYALMAAGLVLLVRAVGAMNFAQGDFLSIGAFITYWLSSQLLLPEIPMIISAILIFACFGVLFMFSIYWPVRKARWPGAFIICSLGAGTVIREALRLIWGANPLPADPIIKGSLIIGSVRLEYQYLIIIGVSCLIVGAIFFLFDKMYIGKLMQASSQDSYAAKLLGIPTVLTTAITFMIVLIITGIGGYLVSPLFLISTSLSQLQLRAFAGAVLGGFGNVKGAILGSLVIGLVGSYSSLFTSTYNDAVVFLVLIICLIIRPTGFFGNKVSDKA